MKKTQNKPTKDQIKAEIEKLTTMKPTVLHQSAFGDDHHAAIDAQIDVLMNEYSEDDVYEEYPNIEEDEVRGYPQNVCDSARDAAVWLEGESEDGAPSDEWQSLVRK